MDIMNRTEIINLLNDYATSDDNKIIDVMNDMIDNKEYKNNFDLFCMAISSTQLYGYLSYFTEKERNIFYDFDFFRTVSYKGKSINYLNSGQLSFLNELDIYNKVFFSAPTSFGKTSIIIEFILENYLKLRNILFIIPTNSLLEELFIKFSKFNKDFNLEYNVSTQPYFKQGCDNLLILTPERFLLIHEDSNIKIFDLIIMDETYKIVDSKNEYISDFVESRALRFRKVADLIANNERVLFLSPFTYNLTESMKYFLEKYNITKVDRKIEYVKRKIIKVSDAKDFFYEFGCSNNTYSRTYSIAKKTTILMNELKKDQNIIYVGQYSKAYEIVNKYSVVNNNIKFEDARFLAFLAHLKQAYKISEINQWNVIDGLEKGIGIYISPMPRYVKKEIVKLFERNIINNLIVTTSFTEGVNSNAKNLIFTTLINGPTKNKLSDIDVLNVSGRAGRFAKSSVGNIYCISDNINERINKLQDDAIIELENYNYFKSNRDKSDYEIDMIDTEYLNDNDKKLKKDIEEFLEEMQLDKKDLNISLNVSNLWKLILYNSIKNKNIYFLINLSTALKNLISAEPKDRVKSLETVFDFIKESFEGTDIDVFPFKHYEIKPYDNKGGFIWGRLYKIYSSGTIKSIIKSNMIFVFNQFDSIKRRHPSVNNKKELKDMLTYNEKSWILKYYDNNLNVQFNSFYSETFKFISNVIQYKIPFYVTFVASIYNLFVKKHVNEYKDLEYIDIKKVSLIFEDGIIHEEYDKLIDFGISNDMIIKMQENKIKISDLINEKYNLSIFDEYENIVIKDFISLEK